ncbi:MAG TPA: hypothetical protein VE890_09425 [Thermoguttaceae bacterium]|nr:hypothetical protein [Thermoguttaceae bacterium]
MRKFALCLLMPALLAAGSILVGTDRAEARIRPRVVVVPRAVYVQPRPRVYVAPRVDVVVPRVHVHVAPRPYVYYGYGTVIAPGVHVAW